MERLTAQNEELAETPPADELVAIYFRAQGWIGGGTQPEQNEEETLAAWAPTVDEYVP